MEKNNGLFQITEKRYINVSGFRITNSAHEGIRVQGPGASNIIIRKNYIYGTSGSGISAWGNTGRTCTADYDGIVNLTIDGNELEKVFTGKNGDVGEQITIAKGVDTFEIKNNHIHDSIYEGPDLGLAIGGEGIDTKQGVRNGKIYKNHVHHLNRPHRATIGIYIGEWDCHEYNIEVFDNAVHDIVGYGIAVGAEYGGSVDNIRIYNNIVYNNQRDGILVDGYGNPDGPGHGSIKDIKIINNVLYKNGLQQNQGSGGIFVFDENAEGVVIENNIASKNLGFQIAIPSGSSNVKVNSNLIDGYSGFAWSVYKETYGQNSINRDPMFVNPARADYHLNRASPAIDKGSSAYAPKEDFDGNERPKGGGYDIGAFEYVPLSAVNFTFLGDVYQGLYDFSLR